MKTREYPIMMGLGTKILTAYHHPSFKHGLMIAILDSKETHKKGTLLTDEDFKRSANGIRCEMFFNEIEDLDRCIKNLVLLRNQWYEQKMEAKKPSKKIGCHNCVKHETDECMWREEGTSVCEDWSDEE